jgi:hypothetical protein
MKLNSRHARIPWVWISLAVLAMPAISAAESQSFGELTAGSLATWHAFREAQPFQTQLIAVSATVPRTLILSELPPQVAWSHLTASLSQGSRGCSVQRWAIMSGGYVQDVVCTLKDTADGTLTDWLTGLRMLIYGTNLGMPVVSLPVPKRSMSGHSLDLRYRASDLYGWLTGSSQTFAANTLAERISLHTILANNIRGVFASNDHALILWAVDRGAMLKNGRPDFQQFAADSDLVLGAVSNAKTVVVVGRGRIESLAHLPPLRAETALLLAGTVEDKLEQSYERTDFIAGRGVDGIDRAPILLSPQLVNTEFGNLLNVADQLLKGWSLAGLVSYVDFKYPKPPSYPFGTVPVLLMEKHPRESFLFNWNTDGAAYRQVISGIEVMVPQRTGALSVIYGDPQTRPRDLENTAYDYFTGSGDTSLARVVQYTLLFQIFRQFEVRAAAPPVSARYSSFAGSVDQLSRAEINWLLKGGDNKDLGHRLKDYWTSVSHTISNKDIAESGGTREDFVEAGVVQSMEMAAALVQAQGSSRGALADALARYVSYSRLQRDLNPQEEKERIRAAKMISDSLSPQIASDLLEHNGFNLHTYGLLAAAADAVGAWPSLSGSSDDTAWNHTAYVVQSEAHGSLRGATGGHNLDAPIVQLTDSAAQAKGTVSVTQDERGNILVMHNPADSDRAGIIARQVGTRKELDPAQIEAEVNAALKTAAVPPPVDLAAIRPANLIAFGRSSEFKFLRAAESTARTRPLRADEQQLMAALAAEGKQQSIVFEYLSDGSIEMKRSGSTEVLHVANITAATDALANGLLVSAGGRSPVSVLFKGLPPNKTEAVLAQVQASLRRYPKETVERVLSAEGDGALLVERPVLFNERIAHNGIRIERQSIKVDVVTEGPYKGFSRVEVPVTIRARTPLLTKFVFFIKDLTQASLAKLTTHLEFLLAQIKDPVSMADLDTTIRTRLGNDLKELNIDTILMMPKSDQVGKVHDIYIAGRRTAPRHDG